MDRALIDALLDWLTRLAIRYDRLETRCQVLEQRIVELQDQLNQDDAELRASE